MRRGLLWFASAHDPLMWQRANDKHARVRRRVARARGGTRTRVRSRRLKDYIGLYLPVP